MSIFHQDFINNIQLFLKHQNPEKDPSYWKHINNEELPEEAINNVFNVKKCLNCEEWKYTEHFITYPANTENEFKKGISSNCSKC